MQNQCPNCGWVGVTSLDELTIECPLCKKSQVTLKSKEQLGRECWDAIHSLKDPSPESLAKWEETIPRFNCLCVEHYNYFKGENPPDFDNFDRWAIDLHNFINRCLGKPKWGENSTGEPVPSLVSVVPMDAPTSPEIAIATSTESNGTPEPEESPIETESGSTTPDTGSPSEVEN